MLRKYIPNGFNLLVVLFVALGSTACSYGMAIIGSTIGQPSFYKALDLAPQGEPGYGRTAEYIGAFNGVNCAGSAIGAAICSWSADKFGRKRTIQYAATILCIGAAICAGAVNNGMFMAGRIINGFGIGALVTVIPIYQAEVSTPESRGFMVSMHVSLHVDNHLCAIRAEYFLGSHVRHGLHVVRLARLRCLLHLCQWLVVLLPVSCPAPCDDYQQATLSNSQFVGKDSASQLPSKWLQHCSSSPAHHGYLEARDG